MAEDTDKAVRWSRYPARIPMFFSESVSSPEMGDISPPGCTHFANEVIRASKMNVVVILTDHLLRIEIDGHDVQRTLLNIFCSQGSLDLPAALVAVTGVVREGEGSIARKADRSFVERKLCGAAANADSVDAGDPPGAHNAPLVRLEHVFAATRKGNKH